MPKKHAISATLLRITGVGTPIFSRPKASSCQTLSVTIWFSGFCNTYPISQAASLSESVLCSFPQKMISPLFSPSGASSRFKSRSSVLFPQPEAPHSTMNSPFRISRDTSESAGFGSVVSFGCRGYVKLRFLTSSNAMTFSSLPPLRPAVVKIKIPLHIRRSPPVWSASLLHTDNNKMKILQGQNSRQSLP